jgi:hypothetical protein
MQRDTKHKHFGGKTCAEEKLRSLKRTYSQPHHVNHPRKTSKGASIDRPIFEAVPFIGAASVIFLLGIPVGTVLVLYNLVVVSGTALAGSCPVTKTVLVCNKFGAIVDSTIMLKVAVELSPNPPSAPGSIAKANLSL